ncbi:MAG: NHLP bacteriocin system secretion protein [Pseudomonadota bacterium]
MAGEKQLFRKKALAKLASPEQLDTLMQVTEPRGWLALGGLGVVLVAAIIWGFVGRINIKVDGMGILLRGESVQAVSSGTTGRVMSINARVGQQIQAGDIVAQLAQPQLRLRADNTREQLERLREQNAERALAEQTNLIQSEEAIAQEAQSVTDSFADYRRQIEALEQTVEVQKRMVEQGLMTTGTLLGTENQLAGARQALSRAQVRIAQIDSERLTLQRNYRQQLEGRLNRIDQLEADLEELDNQIASTSMITSPYSGRVLEITTNPGDLVSAGLPILTLEASETDIEAVFFVSAFKGKSIKEGMVVRISPSTVKSEEYGFMLGEVRSVSDFPVTPQGLRRVLRNDQLAEDLSGEGAPIEVIARLLPDPSTVSGFEWSSSGGPPTEIFSGTLCTVDVITETKRPVEYVLPIFRGDSATASRAARAQSVGTDPS